MSQAMSSALVLPSIHEIEALTRRRPVASSASGRTPETSVERARAMPPATPLARGRLRTQLTLSFAGAMALFCGLFFGASCASSLSLGATLPSALGAAVSLFCASTLAAWWILGRALRPLEQLAVSADRLDGSWVSTSVNIAGDQLEVHRARSALDRALARLRESQVALDLFVCNVAHELQDPVSTVLAEARGMAGGEPSVEALTRFARSAGDEVARIGKIISGSLTLARLDSAPQLEELAPVCMLDIALDVVKHANSHAESQGVRLVLMLPDSAEVGVRGDADLVSSMLENVVCNAIAHSPRGEEVLLELECVAFDLRITVRDHGPGVPEALLPHVLEAHVRGPRKGHGARGRGLGLALASRIAHYHRGSIRIANHHAGGCEVVMTLPLRRASAVPKARRHSSRGASSPAAQQKSIALSRE